jgi:hypothetical protein
MSETLRLRNQDMEFTLFMGRENILKVRTEIQDWSWNDDGDIVTEYYADDQGPRKFERTQGCSGSFTIRLKRPLGQRLMNFVEARRRGRTNDAITMAFRMPFRNGEREKIICDRVFFGGVQLQGSGNDLVSMTIPWEAEAFRIG